MRCAACGYQGRVPPQIEESMRSAGEVLKSLDARGRQLDARQHKALSSGGLRSILVLVPVLLVTVPALLWAALGGALFLPVLDFVMFFFFAVPLLVTGTADVLAFIALRRSRRRLLEACAATPPEVTGGSAACHLCGAPLQGSTEAIVRCAFCQADNVVDARLLAQLGSRSVKGIERIEDQVRVEAARVGSAARGAGLAVAGAGCLGPVAMIGLLIATMVITSQIEADMKPDKQYAVVRSDAGECVAKVTKVRDTWRISYGGGPESGYIPWEDRKSLDGLTVQSPGFLAGQRVRIHHLKRNGTVVKVFSHPMQDNEVRVKLDDGTLVETAPQGLCLGG